MAPSKGSKAKPARTLESTKYLKALVKQSKLVNAFLRERQAIEDSYGKALKKLGQQYHGKISVTEGIDNQVSSTFSTVCELTTNIGARHCEFASHLLVTVVEPTTSKVKALQKERKSLQGDVDKAVRQVSTSHNALQRAQTRYDSACAKVTTIQTAMVTASESGGVKQLDKLNKQLLSSVQDRENCDLQRRQCGSDHDDTKAYLSRETKRLLKSFKTIDTSRSSVCVNGLRDYAALHQATVNDSVALVVALGASADALSHSMDTQTHCRVFEHAISTDTSQFQTGDDTPTRTHRLSIGSSTTATPPPPAPPMVHASPDLISFDSPAGASVTDTPDTPSEVTSPADMSPAPGAIASPVTASPGSAVTPTHPSASLASLATLLPSVPSHKPAVLVKPSPAAESELTLADLPYPSTPVQALTRASESPTDADSSGTHPQSTGPLTHIYSARERSGTATSMDLSLPAPPAFHHGKGGGEASPESSPLAVPTDSGGDT